MLIWPPTAYWHTQSAACCLWHFPSTLCLCTPAPALAPAPVALVGHSPRVWPCSLQCVHNLPAWPHGLDAKFLEVDLRKQLDTLPTAKDTAELESEGQQTRMVT
jgi:hypothetical protein